MNYTHELYPSPYGTGYRILADGQPIVEQDYLPRASGFQGMTPEQAEAEAEAEIAGRAPDTPPAP